jgi:3-oxoacyl-[acyl-carrier-protein] synthase-3
VEHRIGREARLTGARIMGVVSCVPPKIRVNEDFHSTFGESAVADVVKMIGVQSRHQVEGTVTTRDLCRHAATQLLGKLEWSPDSVDAVLFVSQTPDFRLPPTACALQADLGVEPGCIAFDINLGCSGYPYALWLGMSMIQTGAARRVLLAVGDTISRVVDPNDRATALLFGDAGTVTALEADPTAPPADFPAWRAGWAMRCTWTAARSSISRCAPSRPWSHEPSRWVQTAARRRRTTCSIKPISSC